MRPHRPAYCYIPHFNLSLHQIGHLSVFRPDEIRHGLRLALEVVGTVTGVVNVVCTVTVAVLVVRFGWADVVKFVDAAALWATLDRPVAGSGEPDDVVGVRRAASAANVLLVTERTHDNRVVEGT